MKYGYFDDMRKEYVITTPFTPRPWINYLGTEGFFSLISNTGGGYSFYRDAKLRRITRFRYNDVPEDTGGRCVYIADGKEVWSPCFAPVKVMPDFYECRHGLGYTVIDAVRNGLSVQSLFFVPIGHACELHRITLKNESEELKEFSLYNVREWCLWNADDDQSNFQRNYNTGEVEVEANSIYHKTEYRERRNHYAFFASSLPFDGYDTERRVFLGRFNGWDAPAAVKERTNYSSRSGGWSPIACERFDFRLQAGEEKTLCFILGYVENEPDRKFERKGVIEKRKAKELTKFFSDDGNVLSAWESLKEYWTNTLSAFAVNSGIVEFDRMVGIWNPYQCMVTFNLSRSASYFESGLGRGMGFRDSCQDLLGGSLVLPPQRVRERIIDIASIQFKDGSTYHQYQPLTKRGNADIGGGFNDDPLWLIACTAEYIKETGDMSILEELVPFNNEAGSEVPLMEHLRASFQFTVTHRGPHGLPLIGRADWNDCLNLNCFSTVPGESFQTCANRDSGIAESVFIAGMFVRYGKEFAELLRRTGREEECAAAIKEVEFTEQAVLKHGWDGEWFLRAYDSFGNKVGSAGCDEGKIYVEPQGFCTLAEIGGKEYGEKAMRSVKKYLLSDYGVELLYPCYSEYHLELGEISSYPPGYKENGSVFFHNNPWLLFAMSKIGDGNGAYELYRRITPSYLENISEIRGAEPYVYSQTAAGRAAATYGEVKNSWLTGTASWMLYAATQAVLGIQADYDGLRISPCLPDEMENCSVTRMFRGCRYEITIVKKLGTKKGIWIDGRKSDSKIISPVAGKTLKVEVYI